MKVVASRPDGLGTRLLNLVAARYFAEIHNNDFALLWRDIKSKFYDTNLLQSDSIVDFFDNGKVFRDIEVQLLDQDAIDTLTVKKLSSKVKGLKVRDIYCSEFVDADAHGGRRAPRRQSDQCAGYLSGGRQAAAARWGEATMRTGYGCDNGGVF